MFDDKYVDQPHGMPIVTFHADYYFDEYIPPQFIKIASSDRLIFTHQHCHSDFEILYITHGLAEYTINDDIFSLSAGDMIITNPYDLHYGITPIRQDRFSYYCIDFDLDCITDNKENLFPWVDSQKTGRIKYSNYIPAAKTSLLAEYVINLHKAYTTRFDGWKLSVKGNLCLLFAHLIKNKYYQEDNTVNNEFMKSIFDYVEENYTRPITSKDVASHFSYSHSYFCRYFKKNFSSTFSEFLNIYRIKQATALIENGHTKVSDLTTMVGFNNFSYFSNTFKKYNGVLPSVYIARLARQPVEK